MLGEARLAFWAVESFFPQRKNSLKKQGKRMKDSLKIVLSALVLSVVGVGGAEHAEAKRGKVRPVVVRGEISALSAASVTVNSMTIALTQRTKYEDFAENLVSLDAFVVGDCVKVKLLPGQVTAVAREMELEAHCKTGISSRRDDDRSSSTRTPPRRPTPNSSDDNGGRTIDDRGSDDDSRDDKGRGRGRGRGRGGR